MSKILQGMDDLLRSSKAQTPMIYSVFFGCLEHDQTHQIVGNLVHQQFLFQFLMIVQFTFANITGSKLTQSSQGIRLKKVL
jgi:hypothetical protein